MENMCIKLIWTNCQNRSTTVCLHHIEAWIRIFSILAITQPSSPGHEYQGKNKVDSENNFILRFVFNASCVGTQNQ